MYLLPVVRTLVAVVLVTALAGCTGESETETVLREDPFVVRPFQPYSGERLIDNAICYGPHRDGQRPGALSPSAAEMREDLRLMETHWNLLRVYGSVEFTEVLLNVIRHYRLDMKVMLGAWIAPDATDANRQEVDAAIHLANTYPDIVIAVCVGNETQVFWSAHRSSLDGLIEHVRRVRASVSVPVTVADDFAYWLEPVSRKLAGEVDFITMHAHPMWNGIRLASALSWIKDRVSAVQALHSECTVVLGETGWATSVHDQGEQAELIKGVPGEDEQKQFYEAVRSWAAEQRRAVFFFEAFDENWKGGMHPAEVEKHWGLYRADRSPKAALTPDTGK